MEINMWKVVRVAYQRRSDGWDFVDVILKRERQKTRILIVNDYYRKLEIRRKERHELVWAPGKVWR